MQYAEAVQALEALYARLPRITCQRQCQEACGPVLMSRLEWLRVRRHAPGKGTLTPALTCPMLRQGRCAVYGVRPLICRLYGLIDDPRMRCPFGCVPERWVTQAEAQALLEEAQEISTRLFPGQVPLDDEEDTGG